MSIHHDFRPNFYYQSGRPEPKQNHTAFPGMIPPHLEAIKTLEVIEILRVYQHTVFGESLSIRVKLDNPYRIFCEYDNECEVIDEPFTSFVPLTQQELVKYLDAIHIGGEPFCFFWNRYKHPKDALNYCTLYSDVYPQINEYYQQHIIRYYEEQNHDNDSSFI